MAIITISRGCFSHGRDIAEGVAKKLGYECVSREILLETSEHFHIPELKLTRALHDAPSILDRFTHGKQRYVAFIQEAFLEHMQRGNVVYHGLAGQFFLKGVSHALKVRIIADIEDRIKLEMERENISGDKARHDIKKDDFERNKWAMTLHGINIQDPSLYDLVVHIHKIKVDEAIDIICHTAGLPAFQKTPESKKALDNLVLASRVKCEVIKDWPDIQVSADQGNVVVHVEAPLVQETIVSERIVNLVRNVSGVKDVKVHVRPFTV